MKLQNPFPSEVRLLFIDVYSCFECGRSDRGLELHHIWGRISCSALNAIPLCTVCHGKVLHTQKEHQHFLQLTIDWLHKQRYKLIPRDWGFLELVKTDLRGFSLMR